MMICISNRPDSNSLTDFYMENGWNDLNGAQRLNDWNSLLHG